MRAIVFSLMAAMGLAAASGSARAERELPDVHSHSAVVVDADTATEIFAKDADEVRAIASTTKIFVALAVRRHGLDLDGWTQVTKEDARAARGGARTRLDVGQTFKNSDLLRAMLMASDNRAPTALGRAAGLSASELIAAMNDVAHDLGLKKTKFTDTSGLRGNVSTAREMALALRKVLTDDVLRDIMHTDEVTVKAKGGYKVHYTNTNQALTAGRYNVIGGKTGYTKPAGYCLITEAEIAGRNVVMAFLGGDGKLTRFADFDRVAKWLDDGAPGATVKPSRKARRQHPTLAVSSGGSLSQQSAP